MVNDERTTYSYNSNSRLENTITERWNSATSSWKNNNRWLHTYDAAGYRTLLLWEFFDDALNVWGNGQQFYFWYEANTINSNANEIRVVINASVYPNPASHFINLRTHFEQPTVAEMFLSDYTGRIVMHFGNETLQGETEKQYYINRGEVARGMYFITIKTANGSKSLPLMIK